jgi:bilin biosynthesis protein
MSLDNLLQQLKHPNPNLQNRAMWQIAEEKSDETIPRLIAILGEEDVAYRRAAVKALGVIGIDAVPALVKLLLNNEDATVRSSCAKGLAQIIVNHPEVPFPIEGIEALRKAINDPNPVVHIASVMALGEVGEPAFDILVDILKTTDNLAVGVATINAIGSSGDKRGVQVLSELAEDASADTYIRESATSALSRLEMVINYGNKQRSQDA